MKNPFSLALATFLCLKLISSSSALLPNALHSKPPSLFRTKHQHPRGGCTSLHSSKTSSTGFIKSLKEEYKLRLQADQNFTSKSIIEVFLAATTQFTAEIGRRGRKGILTEIDFVIAGIVTAIAGKYYSMWRTAPTVKSQQQPQPQPQDRKLTFPTNAFQTDQSYSFVQRCLSFLIPIPSLFQAGFIASALGYGLTAIFISLRSTFIPHYEAATVNVNIFHASLYTGGFVAIVSNIRYQLLQGIIEPKIIERWFVKFPWIKAALIFLARLANGLLGSYLAIAGMKMFGVQRLK